MRTPHRFSLSVIFLASVSLCAGAASTSDTLKRIYDNALAHASSYEQLRELTTRHPGRLAGTTAYNEAATWAENVLRQTGCDAVELQPVVVPLWDRGGREEVLLLGGSAPKPLCALELGWSVATPEGGLRAEVIEVQSLEELRRLGEPAVKGKVVFFNRPMAAGLASLSEAYRQASDQRNIGPAEAAKLGAVAALVRSLTPVVDDVPHTGFTRFAPGEPRIPAAALSTAAADRLSTALKSSASTEVELRLHGRWLGEAPSSNVIGEIRGSEFPDEILVVGAHLDSWDITPGAHDDGAGVVQAIEVLRLFRELGIRPRHTLRCVLFTAEENSLAGGRAYAQRAKERKERHLFALESDAGGFGAQGFDFAHATVNAAERAARWREVLRPFGLHLFQEGKSGSDVVPLLEVGATVASLRPESARYFNYHHTRIDTYYKVDPRELQLGAAAMAALIWLVDTEGL